MKYAAVRAGTTAVVFLLLLLALPLAWPEVATAEETKCPFAGRRPPIGEIHKGPSSQRSSLCKANLAGTNLAGIDLAGADLTAANLKGSNLARANLKRARLAGANLAGSHLGKANLNGSRLAGADLGGANLVEADLTGAEIFASFGSRTHLLAECGLRAAAELDRQSGQRPQVQR